MRNIQVLALEMIQEAKSGHGGIVMSAAPILYALYKDHVHFDVENPNWQNRDRVVLSAGHGSALLYATLFMAGFPYTIEDLKAFRKYGSKTPGHPEYDPMLGIEMTTGPLGEGVSSAVGMALGEKLEAMKNPNQVDYYVYAVCGDGDLMEGVSYEALSLAGIWQLDHLILLYDANKNSLDSSLENTFTENVMKRFLNLGFEVLSSSSDATAISMAIACAKKNSKPTVILVDTILGKDSSLENSHKAHGWVPSEEEIKILKQKWDLPKEKFAYLEKMREEFSKKIYQRSIEKEKNFPNLPSSNLQIPKEFSLKSEDMRSSFGELLNLIEPYYPLYCGSADLSSSCKNVINNGEIFSKDHYGKNIFFGVREHAMAAIMNGFALTGHDLIGSTFLAFSDYMKPAIRLSALMNLSVCYLFTHDSIRLGKDGPTHEPIEQLTTLRSIPNFSVFRPCNHEEMIQSFLYYLEKKIPCAFLISRSGKTLSTIEKVEAQKGAYIFKKEKEHCDRILLSSGEDIKLSLDVAEILENEYNLDIRIVSMPCRELFLKQEASYQNSVLNPEITYVIESATAYEMLPFVKNAKQCISLHHFGASGEEMDVLKACHFTKEEIAKTIGEGDL